GVPRRDAPGGAGQDRPLLLHVRAEVLLDADHAGSQEVRRRPRRVGGRGGPRGDAGEVAGVRGRRRSCLPAGELSRRPCAGVLTGPRRTAGPGPVVSGPGSSSRPGSGAVTGPEGGRVRAAGRFPAGSAVVGGAAVRPGQPELGVEVQVAGEDLRVAPQPAPPAATGAELRGVVLPPGQRPDPVHVLRLVLRRCLVATALPFAVLAAASLVVTASPVARPRVTVVPTAVPAAPPPAAPRNRPGVLRHGTGGTHRAALRCLRLLHRPLRLPGGPSGGVRR